MVQPGSHVAGVPGYTLAEIAELVDALDGSAFPATLGHWLTGYVPAINFSLIAFASDAPARNLYSDITGFDEDLEIYVKGPYLLDPFYRAFVDTDRRGLLRLDELMPGELREEDFFKKYYRWAGYVDESGYLVDVDPTTCLHVSVCAPGEEGFDDVAWQRLADAEPLVTVLLRTWARHSLPESAENARQFHQHLVSAVAQFGSSALTPRECDIVQLMLRGHSAKSTARELDISPGTVNLHRSHIYEKLGVGNQGELFSLFLDALLNGDVFRGGDVLAARQ